MPLTRADREGRPPEPRISVMRIPTPCWRSGAGRCSRAATAAVALLLTPVVGVRANAQAHFYNLDAGRPTRVEDALPTERYGLDLHLAALRVERLDDGTYRWRAEPKLSFGALPMTSLELRAPITHLVRPGAGGRRTTALAGIGIGA